MRKRFDSVLLRLMLTQLALLVFALLTIGALLVVERNRLLAEQNTDLRAPAIIAAARNLPPAAWPDGAATLGIERHDSLPAGYKADVTRMPGVQAFMKEMLRYDMTFDDVRLSHSDGHFILWGHARWHDGPPVWLSGYAPRLWPHWSDSLLFAMALFCLVSAAMSWRFANRVTQPLAQLRRRMQAHAMAGIQPDEAGPPLVAGKHPRELIAIDRAYRQLAERLQRNERERALLLAGVSHDLRSPLSRIRLAAEMLPESPDNQAGVASITRNVDQADQLTASFLEFIRTGTVELNQRVDLAAVARQAVAQFDLSDLALRAHTPPSLWLEGAHGLLLERLIFNLVDNALKHGATPVEISVDQLGETAVLRVSDAGPGMPAKDAGRLMEAFSRGDVSRGLPGFGLGLAISQQIVVRLQGELAFGHESQRHQVQARFPLSR